MSTSLLYHTCGVRGYSLTKTEFDGAMVLFHVAAQSTTCRCASCGSTDCVRRGSHTAVRALEKAMLDYLDQRNRKPKPFVWTADADLILGKVARLSKRISRSGH